MDVEFRPTEEERFELTRRNVPVFTLEGFQFIMYGELSEVFKAFQYLVEVRVRAENGLMFPL